MVKECGKKKSKKKHDENVWNANRDAKPEKKNKKEGKQAYLPALTKNIMQRGFLRESTNFLKSLKPSSLPASAARASSPKISFSYRATQVSTLASDLLATLMLNPFSHTLRAKFCPITPNPYNPMSAMLFVLFSESAVTLDGVGLQMGVNLTPGINSQIPRYTR